MVFAPSSQAVLPDIFFNNCFKNGLLPIRLAEEQVGVLFKTVDANAGYKLVIDLEQQMITAPGSVGVQI